MPKSAAPSFTGGHYGATPSVHVHLVDGQLLQYDSCGRRRCGCKANTQVRRDGHPHRRLFAMHSEHLWRDPVHSVDLGCGHSRSCLRILTSLRLLLRGTYSLHSR